MELSLSITTFAQNILKDFEHRVFSSRDCEYAYDFYYNQIKDKPTLSSVSGALDRYFKTGDVMDKNKAAFLIQSTPEAKEALGLQ